MFVSLSPIFSRYLLLVCSRLGYKFNENYNIYAYLIVVPNVLLSHFLIPSIGLYNLCFSFQQMLVMIYSISIELWKVL